MIVLEVVFLTVFWAWVFSAVLLLRNTFLPRLPITDTPADLNLPFEVVRFQATDGVHLEGWKIPGELGRPWIMMCHGAGANRSDLLDMAAGLHGAGFSLLLFDFRGHGTSRGRVISFGWHEQHDVEGALAFLGQQPDVPAKPYGIYGISMGGAVALMVAAHDERIGAVAVDSPYTNLEETLGRHLTLISPLIPRIPFLWFVLATYRLRFGIWPRHISPLDSAARLRPRPFFLIQGSQDPRMPLEGAKRLFAAAGEPKELWIVEGAEHDHVASFRLDPHVYCARLVRFFQTSV